MGVLQGKRLAIELEPHSLLDLNRVAQGSLDHVVVYRQLVEVKASARHKRDETDARKQSRGVPGLTARSRRWPEVEVRQRGSHRAEQPMARGSPAWCRAPLPNSHETFLAAALGIPGDLRVKVTDGGRPSCHVLMKFQLQQSSRPCKQCCASKVCVLTLFVRALPWLFICQGNSFSLLVKKTPFSCWQNSISQPTTPQCCICFKETIDTCAWIYVDTQDSANEKTLGRSPL